SCRRWSDRGGQVMSRRRWLLFLTLVLAVAAVCALETQRIVTGWLCGEAFYRGRPTTYWRARLAAWQGVGASFWGNIDTGLFLDDGAAVADLFTAHARPESA